MNDIDEFRELSKQTAPEQTEVTLTFQNGNIGNFIITEHFDTYDDPLKQKYKLTAGQHTYYLVFQDAEVQIIREDADSLPFGQKRTIKQIEAH